MRHWKGKPSTSILRAYMAKLLLDTSVYILKLRGQLASEIEEQLRRALPLTFLASVVAYELYRGAIDRAGKRLINHLVTPFEKTGRVITPSHGNWRDAARIVTALLRTEPSLATKVPALQNDTLIALSARHVGATVWTSDAEDFSLIRQQRPFRLRIVERRSSRPAQYTGKPHR